MTIQLHPQNGTVLVVDDTPESLRFLTDTLEAARMAVLIATTGEEALELLSRITPDLILMDAVMPGMGGFEATRAIKRSPPLALVPVIFMTGLTESEHVVRALEAGGVDYVRKPIVIEELLARVRVHMANARVAEGGQLALDASGRNLIAVADGKRVSWLTPGAEQILAEAAPGWSSADPELPDLLRPALARLTADGVASGASAKIDMPGDSALELVVVARQRSNETLIRLNLVNPALDISKLQAHFGLTSREAEILLWISYGKPNRVISEILTISPRTVNKHLEQIFEKLGVETRAAAAAFAVRAITD